MELQTVSQVSKALGISAQMLRYYERTGLITSLRKEDYAYRVYDAQNITRLQQIVILRKLQIPLKQITVILTNQSVVDVIDVFTQNISELDMQITALSTIRSILTRFTDMLRDKTNAQPQLDLLSNKSMIALVDALSFPENKIRETISMDDLSKASNVLDEANKKTPVIIIFPTHKDEFSFLGVEQAVKPDTDFGMVWDTYFKTAEKAGLAPYSHIIWYYKGNKQMYFIGTMAEKDCTVPEGCATKNFPASEYAVVTHEWLQSGADLYTNGIMLTQNYCGIGQTHCPQEGIQLPDGYARHDGPGSPITQIEVENNSKGGLRFERWVPVVKVVGEK